MPNNSWQFDSDTNSYHKQVGQYDFEANRHGMLRIYSGEHLEAEHSTRNLLAAKEDAEYFVKHGSLPEPVQEIQQYQQPIYQPVYQQAQTITYPEAAYKYMSIDRRFMVSVLAALIVMLVCMASFGAKWGLVFWLVGFLCVIAIKEGMGVNIHFGK